MAIRMGKASFFRIVDNQGGIQIFIKMDDVDKETIILNYMILEILLV